MSDYILYTGATGSIASSIIANKKIIPLNFRLEESESKILEKLVNYKNATLIHFAAMTDKEECNKSKKKCLKINVDSSLKLYKIVSKLKFKKFIFVSTSDVYKHLKTFRLIDVNSELKPDSFYSFSKLTAENQLIKLSKNYKYTDLCIARVFNVNSEHYKKNSLKERIINLAKKNKFEYIKGLNKVRDISSSKFICQELLKLAKRKIVPTKINICSEKPTNLFNYVSNIYKDYNLDFRKNYKFKIPKTKNYLVGKKTIY